MSDLNNSKVEGIKSRFEHTVRGLFAELKNSQDHLMEAIVNLNVTNTFGDAKINDVKRFESAVLALPVSDVSYFEGDDFKKCTDSDIHEWAVETYKSLDRREYNFFSSGLSLDKHWEASGVMHVKSKFKTILAIR
jgi:hypothetical protein